MFQDNWYWDFDAITDLITPENYYTKKNTDQIGKK